jgi:hypothetical protein
MVVKLFELVDKTESIGPYSCTMVKVRIVRLMLKS